MKSFRRVALLSTIGVYLLIFIGGLVRVSGAGMGCPDWPKCFGRWVPPTSVTQLPPDMDPTTFNIVLAWIEYFNRLMGLTVGLLLILTVILAIVFYRKVPRIIVPTIAAFILTVYQAWQGGQVVASNLQPLLVSLHLLIAVIIASILIYVTQQAYYIENPSSEMSAVYPLQSRTWVGVLWLIGLLQVILGTQVRSGFDILVRQFPLLEKSVLINRTGPVSYMHAILGVLVGVLTFYAGSTILRQSKQASGMVREGVWVMMSLILVQIVIGMVLFMAGLPSLMQLFHLWIASLYVGTVFVLYWAFRRGLGGAHGI
jgi:cytochrome c oxidase assembly protein subunit 15